MPAPPVVIAANPYEGELCRRALADTGLDVQLAEDREQVVRLVSQARPLVVVIAAGWYHAEVAEILPELRALAESVPFFLIADREGALADEKAAIRAGASRLFHRPIEIEALADAIEKLAVEEELRGEVSAQLDDAVLAKAREPGRKIEFEAPAADEWGDRVPSRISRQPTEVLGPADDPALSLGAPPASTALLRADDVLAEGAGLRFQALASSPDFAVPRGAEARSSEGTDRRLTARAEERRLADRGTAARQLDRELSEAERRLFPDAAPTPPGPLSDYDDALGDIDLDALGLDTLPGVAADVLEATLDARERAAHAGNGTQGDHPANSGGAALVRLAPELAAAAPPAQVPELEEEGDLAETDLAELVASLQAAGYAGRLSLTSSSGERALFFDGGLPVFATSSLLHDRLGDLLFREGKLSREQYARTRELDAPPGRRTAALLVELGLLKPRELFPTLRRHVEELFYACFGWDAGSYRLTTEQPPAEDKLRLSAHPWALVAEAVRRKYGLERLVGRVGPPETVLTPTEAMARALIDCQLSPAERAAAELFDGDRSLADLSLASGPRAVALSESQLYALAWALLAVGALRSGPRGNQDRARWHPAATPVTRDDTGARERREQRRSDEERAADGAIDRERLLAKRAQAQDGDYFEILGVDRRATAHEIDRAHKRLLVDFAAERFSDALRAELGDALAEIHEVVEEAHRVLGDDAVRSAYREHLIPGE